MPMLLVVLAMGCTLLPFAVSLAALRHVSAFSATIALNMEPVYAIVLAIVLLGEQRELEPELLSGRRHRAGGGVPASVAGAAG